MPLKPSTSTAIDPPSAGQPAAITGRPIGQDAAVLMIDDEKLNSFVVAVYLKAAGFRELVHTTDPLGAISLAERTRPDVILLDIEMPKLNGIELLRRIRSNPLLTRTPVLILSASDDKKVRSKAAELQVSGFLKKPIQKSELLEVLGKVIAAARR